MEYYGCPKGAPGPMGITMGGASRAIDQALMQFGVREEDILLGYRKEPPNVEWCKVYIYYFNGGAEFWIQRNGSWVNWSYQEL